MSFPDENQKKVIEHKGRPLVVIAGPGTGKTKTIIHRMIKLLDENPNREVSFITFTRTSRRDTYKKVKKEVCKEAIEKKSDFPRVSTLHTYAKSLVHKFANVIHRNPHFSVLVPEKEDLILLSELIEDLEISTDVKRLRWDISYHCNTERWPEDCRLPETKRHEVLQYFDTLLRFYNCFGMQELVKCACEILSSGYANLPPVFLQVDEYQDLNPMDQKLIRLLSSSKGSEIVVVGDDTQSIYGFRQAYLHGIRELCNSNDWVRVDFSNCYRLPAHILRASQTLIEGKGYLGGNICIPKDDGRKILTLQCTKHKLQINAVAEQIKEIKKTKKNQDGEALSYKDFMILCPNKNFVNETSSALEKDFSIPTKQIKKCSIPEDYWRLLLVLRMFGYYDSLALRQWLKFIGIEQEKIREIRREAIKVGQSLYDYCSKLENSEIMEIFICLEKLRLVVCDPEQFEKVFIDFPHLLIDNSLFPEIRPTIKFAAQIPNSIYRIIESIYEKFGLLDPEEDVSEDDKVLVTTMHKAKGLEAQFVFIPWLSDKFMPGNKRNPEEELRVLYVAITRAKQDVILVFDERREGKWYLKEKAMSPFLKKISAHLQIVRITKSDFNEDKFTELVKKLN